MDEMNTWKEIDVLLCFISFEGHVTTEWGRMQEPLNQSATSLPTVMSTKKLRLVL